MCASPGERRGVGATSSGGGCSSRARRCKTSGNSANSVSRYPHFWRLARRPSVRGSHRCLGTSAPHRAVSLALLCGLTRATERELARGEEAMALGVDSPVHRCGARVGGRRPSSLAVGAEGVAAGPPTTWRASRAD